MSKEKERYDLPHHFSKKFYDQIELFQGEINVTTPLHSKNINVDGNGIYKLAPTQVA